MSEYDPGPLLDDLRKEHAEKTAEHQVKKAMHPYRDKEDLTDIRENIESIKDTLASTDKTLANLKLPKRSAIGQAIQYKIERFSLSDFLFTVVVFVAAVAALGGVGYALYKNNTTPDNAIIACQFDYELNRDGVKTVVIRGVIDWHQDESWGPFQDMEEAKQFAKENHCPE